METVTKTTNAVTPVASAKQTSKAHVITRTASKAAPKGIKFRMLQDYRPAGGAALYAHTAAVLELLSMDKGARTPKARLVTILGPTAVKHHLTATGFFEQDESGVAVSALGQDAFALRRIDPEQKAAFIDILTNGKTTRELPTTYTNPKGIAPL